MTYSKIIKMGVVEEPRASYKTNNSSEEGENVVSMISKSRKGVSFGNALNIAERLSLSLDDLSHILHVSTRSLHRYKKDKLLATDASAVILRLQSLKDDGLKTFEDYQDFAEWLKSPLPMLRGETPFSYLDTSFGFDLIHQILGRIRHGIFA